MKDQQKVPFILWDGKPDGDMNMGNRMCKDGNGVQFFDLKKYVSKMRQDKLARSWAYLGVQRKKEKIKSKHFKR